MLDYDEEARYVFIGDYSGQITVCKLDERDGVQFVNVLKGHNGSIQSLCWDGTKGWLYSGTYVLLLLHFTLNYKLCVEHMKH